jgi:hypothetical protein
MGAVSYEFSLIEFWRVRYGRRRSVDVDSDLLIREEGGRGDGGGGGVVGRWIAGKRSILFDILINCRRPICWSEPSSNCRYLLTSASSVDWRINELLLRRFS